ncbi:MAG: hypothetical protein K6F61_05110 [Clostridiales bacterium]|nr:hypothetical protein [Clostridiales bacterium]
MARQIFIVTAQVVDSNGTFNVVSGYPKTFDSRNYQNDIEKAQRRAEGDMSETWGAMCKRDDRKLQSVMLYTADGILIDSKSYGSLAEEPEE